MKVVYRIYKIESVDDRAHTVNHHSHYGKIFTRLDEWSLKMKLDHDTIESALAEIKKYDSVENLLKNDELVIMTVIKKSE